MRHPELREVHFVLVACLYKRYEYTIGDEVDGVASILDEMIASNSPFLAELQEFVESRVILLSIFDGQPEDSEEAIYRARAFLSSSSVEDPHYLRWSQILEYAAK